MKVIINSLPPTMNPDELRCFTSLLSKDLQFSRDDRLLESEFNI